MNKLSIITLLLVSFLFLIINPSYAQDIGGHWRWQSDNGHHMFTITLEQVYPDTIKGTHCGVFRSGRRIDCTLDQYSLKLTQREPMVYQGTIRSSYSLTIGEIRLTYNRADSTIFFERIKDPKGEFYIPDEITLH